MNALAAALPLNAAEKKVTRDASRALTMTHETIVKGYVFLKTAVSQAAYLSSLQSWINRSQSAMGIEHAAPAIATGTSAVRTGRTKARAKAKTRTAAS